MWGRAFSWRARNNVNVIAAPEHLEPSASQLDVLEHVGGTCGKGGGVRGVLACNIAEERSRVLLGTFIFMGIVQ